MRLADAVRMLLTLLALAVALPGVLAAVHLTLLSVGALLWRPVPASGPPVRFLVLVPARDEEDCIGGTLASIEQVRRPGDTVLVVADHCRDRTAAIAREFGALVLERDDSTPGRAATREAGLQHAANLPWDAVVFIDADTVVQPGFFDACERMLGEADVLQTRAEPGTERGVVAGAGLAAMAVQGVLLPRGRDRLGFSVRLRGSGLVMRRALTRRYRFHAPASEDGVLAVELCLDGIRARHVDDARLRPRSATSLRAAREQRVRWEAGRLAAARAYLGPLLRCRSKICLEAAAHLLTPPLALAVFSLTLGAALAAAGGAGGLAVALLGGIVLLTLDVVVALLMVRARPGTWLSLLAAPWYVLWKLAIQFRAVVSVARRRTSYPPTPRG